MLHSLADACTAVMLEIALRQQEPDRTEMLRILLADGHITREQFDALVERRAA